MYNNYDYDSYDNTIMGGGNFHMNYSCEAFMNFCDEMMIEDIAEEGIKTVIQNKGEKIKVSKTCKEGFKNAVEHYKNTGKTTEMKKFIKWVDGNVREISSRMKNADPKEVKHLNKLKDIYVGWKSSAIAWLTEKM